MAFSLAGLPQKPRIQPDPSQVPKPDRELEASGTATAHPTPKSPPTQVPERHTQGKTPAANHTNDKVELPSTLDFEGDQNQLVTSKDRELIKSLGENEILMDARPLFMEYLTTMLRRCVLFTPIVYFKQNRLDEIAEFFTHWIKCVKPEPRIKQSLYNSTLRSLKEPSKKGREAQFKAFMIWSQAKLTNAQLTHLSSNHLQSWVARCICIYNK